MDSDGGVLLGSVWGSSTATGGTDAGSNSSSTFGVGTGGGVGEPSPPSDLELL